LWLGQPAKPSKDGIRRFRCRRDSQLGVDNDQLVAAQTHDWIEVELSNFGQVLDD
jgi:hypothetical protein